MSLSYNRAFFDFFNDIFRYRRKAEMEFTLSFLGLFFFGIYLAAPLLISLLLFIATVGQIVGRKESWRRSEALYWSFVTATTLGYGDFRPTKSSTRGLSILISITGIILTGIIVAIAIYSATEAFKNYYDLHETKPIEYKL